MTGVTIQFWRLSGAPDDPEDNTVLDKYGADAVYSAVKSLMQAIRTEDEEAQQDAVHRMIQIAKPWTIWRWLESKCPNGKPLGQIPKENVHLIDLEWTEDEQAKLQALGERYSSRCASEAWRVHWLQLACFSVVLGDTEDCNNVSRHWYGEWALDTSVDLPLVGWQREALLPMHVNKHAEYSEPNEDKPLREALLPEQERHESTLPNALPQQKVLQFCPLPGKLRYWRWWLTKYLVDNVDIFHIYAEMGNDEGTEMQLKIQNSHNPCVFVKSPDVGRTGLNLTAANHVVTTQNFWVFIEQCQAFAQVVQLGQHRVPHTWLLNTGPGGYDHCVSDLHHHSGVAQMRVLYNMMSRPNITTSMIHRILVSHEDHTKLLTENGDNYQSDELSSYIVRNTTSRYASLDIQPI